MGVDDDRVALDPRVAALVQQALVLGVGLLSGAALARALGPAQRGDYAIVQIVYVLATPAFSLGVPLALMSRSIAVLPLRVIVLHWLAATAAVAGLASHLLLAEVRVVVLLLLAGPTVVMWSEMVMTRAGLSTRIQRVRALDVALSSAIVVALFGCDVLTLQTAAIALFAPTVVLRVAALLIAARRLGAAGTGSPSVSGLYRMSARRFWPREVLSVSAMYVDVIFAALLLDAHDLGIYAVASAIGKFALAPFSALYGETVRRSSATGQVTGIVRALVPLPTALIVAAVVVMTAFGSRLVPVVFGPEYIEAAVLVPGLLIAFALSGAASMLDTIITVAVPRLASAWPRWAGLVAGTTVWVTAGLHRHAGPVSVVSGLVVANTVVLLLTVLRLVGSHRAMEHGGSPR